MKNFKNKKYEFKMGTYSSLGTKISPFGATVKLKRPSSTTHINFDNISEAVDTIKNHLAQYDTKCEIDALENSYLSSNKGYWGHTE